MKNQYSLYAWLLAVLFLTAVNLFYYPKWKFSNTEATISWDVSGYYMYLPAIFIYKDLKQVAFLNDIQEKYQPAGSPYQVFDHWSGRRIMKYSTGMAVQYLPFFLAAHAVAAPLGYPADGFSRPYQLAISLGSLLIAVIGLWFMRKNLLRYFDDRPVAGALLLLVFATNYLDYSAINGAMTHNYLFTLYALLIWQTIRFYERPTYRRSLAIGLIVGLAALTRPTELIAVIIPVLWGVKNAKDLRDRIQFLLTNWQRLALAMIACGLVGSLQLIYWKTIAHEWLVYSYEDQGFSWLSPHIKNCLFSYRAGWLVYTPVMVFSLIGFYALYRRARSVFFPGLLFSLLFMYIAFSWDIWWYGGSLGQRSMVQAYAVLAFPLTAFLSWVLERRWTAIPFLALALFFIYHNLWWTHQAHRGGLFASEQMTRGYYWQVLFKNRENIDPDAYKLLDTDEIFTGERKNIQTIYENNFESDTTAFNCPVDPIEGRQSLCLDQERQFSPEYEVPLQPEAGAWVRASATFRCQWKEWNYWQMTQLIVRYKFGEKIVKERAMRVYRYLDNGQTERLYLDCRRPPEDFDRVTVLFWNAESNKSIAVDEMKVEVFDP